MKTKRRNIPPANLVAHPRNPRTKLTKASIAPLVDSIRELGLLQPVLVREMPDDPDRYQILSGHRRVAAIRVLDLATVPCDEGACGDREALEIMLTSIEQHEPVDPLLEAAAIAELLKLYDGSVRDVADRLGLTPRQVADVRSLDNLSKAWRARFRREPWKAWPVSVWRMIASLAQPAQDELAEEMGKHRMLEDPMPSVGWIRDEVRRRVRVIGQAIFDPNDVELFPDAGACAACPKTSQSCPGLFDDGKPIDLSKAVCRDGACWLEKEARFRRRQVATMRAKYEGLVLVTPPNDYGRAPAVGARVLRHGDYAESKKGVAGAVPALVVTGACSRIRYVKPKASASRKKKAAARARGPSLKSLEAELRKRRAMKLHELILGSVPEKPPERGQFKHDEFSIVHACIGFFGASPWNLRTVPKLDVEHGPHRTVEIYGGNKYYDRDAWLGRVWPAVRSAIEHQHRYAHEGPNPKRVRALLVELFDLDVAALEAKAKEAIKPGKDLLAARAAKKTPKKKAAKKKRARRKAGK